MPARYPAPSYPPAQYAQPQFVPQGAVPPGQWLPLGAMPPGAVPPGQWLPPPPGSARAPGRPGGTPAPRGASYPSRRTPPPQAGHPRPRPAKPAARSTGRSAAGWSVLLAVILFLMISGTGRELLDTLAELLNR